MRLSPEEKSFISAVHQTNLLRRTKLLLRLKREKTLNEYLKKEQNSFLSLINSTRPLVLPDAPVLLLGCANLSLFPLLRRYFKNISALDPSPQLVANAKSYKYPCTQQYFEELSSFPETFDFVIAFNVFQLSLYPESILQSIYAILNPGGILAHVTPHTFPNIIRDHICNYDSRKWAALYQESGFHILSSSVKIFNQKEFHLIAMKP